MKLATGIVVLTLGCVWASPVTRDDYDPDTENVYHLFTRSNPSVSQPLLLANAGLLSGSNFDATKRTVVLVHGASSGASGEMTWQLVPAFLAARDVNVIAVDWERGSYMDNDVAIIAGEGTARFLNWLQTMSGQSLELHVVGFSRGAHHAGIAARNYNGEVLYVTGLDPSGAFESNGLGIQRGDGAYTEIIWSSVPGVVSGNIVGPYGDVDFYPNRGHYQPGCNAWLCDHFRAINFFAESVVTGGFTGTECSTLEDAIVGNCAGEGRLQMGQIDPSLGATGLFFLNTNAASPFSIN